jgi:hypothetical protein
LIQTATVDIQDQETTLVTHRPLLVVLEVVMEQQVTAQAECIMLQQVAVLAVLMAQPTLAHTTPTS